jgi:hypothetical protein
MSAKATAPAQSSKISGQPSFVLRLAILLLSGVTVKNNPALWLATARNRKVLFSSAGSRVKPRRFLRPHSRERNPRGSKANTGHIGGTNVPVAGEKGGTNVPFAGILLRHMPHPALYPLRQMPQEDKTPTTSQCGKYHQAFFLALVAKGKDACLLKRRLRDNFRLRHRQFQRDFTTIEISSRICFIIWLSLCESARMISPVSRVGPTIDLNTNALAEAGIAEVLSRPRVSTELAAALARYLRPPAMLQT